MNARKCVAIDGPAGAGKSTVARGLAARLGWLFIDTGAMYRAVTLKAMRAGIDLENAGDVAACARDARIALEGEPDALRVLLDGEDVSRDIREPELTARVKYVAGNRDARAALVEKQQAMAMAGPAVMEGRDIGTVVLVDAAAKFFLDASIEERARRRANELRQRGMDVDEESLKEQIAERDRSDRERADGPLRQADDAELIQTDGMSVDDVISLLYGRTRERMTSTGTE